MYRTAAEAEAASPYDLARRWLDQPGLSGMAPDGTRDVDAVIDELAIEAALATWLRRWLPISVHRALLLGASLNQVAAAAGLGPTETVTRWRRWVEGQRNRYDVSRPGIGVSPDEYDRVNAILVAAGHGE